MVWKIRSKTAFLYQHGVHRYVVGNWKTVPIEIIDEVPFYEVKTDLYTSVKIIHNYRNISRAAKQFLLGDKVAEQYLVSLLRAEFLYPNSMQSPIYLYVPLVSSSIYSINREE